MRKRSIPDPFEVFLAYVTARLIDNPHLWVRTLCDELGDLGYSMSYQTLHRKICELKLRPICQACLTATEHPPEFDCASTAAESTKSRRTHFRDRPQVRCDSLSTENLFKPKVP